MEGWHHCKLGDVIELKRGYDLPQKERKFGSVPLVSSSGISGTHSVAKVKGPGVITGRYGTIGKVYYVEFDFWPLNTTLYVRDFKGNDPRFISYFLRGVDFNAYSDKAAVPGLNRNDLHEASVFVPPLPEQRAIAATLGALDDKIELNRKMNATLEAMARALFRDWFVDFGPTRAKMAGRPPYLSPDLWSLFPDRLDADGKPEGWEQKPLTAFFSIVGGGTPKTSNADFWGGPIPWFSVTDTPPRGSVFVTDTEKTITDAGLNGSSARLVPKGTTIISARGTVGNLAVAGRDMTFNQSCYGLHGTGSVGDYTTYLIARNMVSQLQARAHGSVFSTITRQTFESLFLPMPSERVLRAFEHAVSPLFDKILANVLESRALAQTRDFLLPRLMSGEVRVAEAARAAEAAT